MSRIWVSNLPEHVREARLREFFSQKGEVTDAKLIRNEDGESRKFGFVGFRSEREAQEALEYFNGSYMYMCKISCEIARKIGYPEIPRPRSRHSSQKEGKLSKEKKVAVPKHSRHMNTEGFEKDTENDDRKEYFQVIGVKSKLWSNDTLAGHPEKNGEKSREKQVQVKAKGRRGVLRKGKIDSLDDDASEEGSFGNSDDHKNESGEPSSSFNDDKESLETPRLFVINLPYTTTEDELEEHFSKFGNILQVHLVVDRDTKCSKGRAYVLYSLPESAARAIEELDNSIFQGRVLHVMPANQNKSFERQEINGVANKSKTFKEKREDERKASEASGNTRAWNSLFMHSDTVVEYVARKFGYRKHDLLHPEATAPAVSLALAETQVIADTKKALANAGVNVSLLEKLAAGKAEGVKGSKEEGVKRSNHIILVKNLPYGSSESELASMFGKFGSLDKIILPPTKTLCLVVFLEPAEARAAFRKLTHKRYKDSPLYLEWAPADVLSQNSKTVGDANETSADANKTLLEQLVEGITDADIDPDRVESRSLYVTNLNFITSDERLRKHFKENVKEGKIMSVKVKKKEWKNGKIVSMGYGFVEFDSVDTATKVCRDLQGTVLDGMTLKLQLCHSKNNKQTLKKVERDQSSTKLLVKNVAFEATKEELRQLFSPFGKIKRLRLPKGLRNHRGFVFVEYETKQEAQNALQALSNTHLYSRHLVLERANEGESLDELRAKTARQFTDERHGFQNPTSLSRKRKRMTVLDEGRVKFGRIAA